jgi:hypothetical protein
MGEGGAGGGCEEANYKMSARYERSQDERMDGEAEYSGGPALL